jgi:excisionase family DNA binding protein
MAPKIKDNQGSTKVHRINHPVAKRLYTLPEAAQYMGRSLWSLRDLIWSGALPVVRSEGGRKLYVDVQDLDAFISQNKFSYL